MANVFREKIDLRAGGFSISPAATHLAFAGHGPVILGYRHRFDHLRVKVIRKNAVELQVMERCIIGVGRLDGVHDELNQVLK